MQRRSVSEASDKKVNRKCGGGVQSVKSLRSNTFAGASSNASGVLTQSLKPGLVINDHPAEALVVVKCDIPHDGKRGIPSFQGLFRFYLSSLERMIDVKRRAYGETRKFEDTMPEHVFMKARITLEDSAVEFLDEHPSFLLAQLLNDKLEESDRVINVRLHPYPSTTDNVLATSGYLLKVSENRLKTSQRRWFVIANRLLKYGKDPRSKLKAVPLSDFNVVDSDTSPLSFEIVTPGRSYHLTASSKENRDKWTSELRLLYLSYLDERPAIDQKDIDGNAFLHCAMCRRKFSWRFKKHMCKVCGFGYCEDHFVADSGKCVEDDARGSLNRQKSVASMGVPPVQWVNGAKVSDDVHMVGKRSLNARSTSSMKLVDEAGLDDGMLILNVVQARNVMSSDRNNLSDPYCVVYFEGEKYTTHAVKETLDPVWKCRFEIAVRGIGHSIQVAVFDEDTYTSDDFLGMVFIPLHHLESGKTYDSWHPLIARPGKYGVKDTEVRGRVHLQMVYKCPIKSLLAPIREFRHKGGLSEIAPPHTSFSFSQVGRHYERFQTMWDKLQIPVWKERVHYITSWRHPPLTLLWMLVYTYAILYVPVSFAFILPTFMILFFLASNFIDSRFFHLDHRPSDRKSSPKRTISTVSTPEGDEEDYEDDENFEDDGLDAYLSDGESQTKDVPSTKHSSANEKNPGRIARMRKARETMLNLQTNLGEFVTMLEKIETLMTWRSPLHTTLFAIALAALSIVLAIVRMRILLLIGGLLKFVSPLKKRLKLLRQGKRGTELEEAMVLDTGSDVVNFVARAPNPWDHKLCVRNLPKELKKA